MFFRRSPPPGGVPGNSRPGNSRPGSAPGSSGRRGCSFWSCGLTVSGNLRFCRDHEAGRRDGSVDDCPGCGRGKHSRYPCCLDCRRVRDDSASREAGLASGQSSGQSSGPAVSPQGSRGPLPARERSPAWRQGDEAASCFYAYLLRLDDGSFYAGQTRDIRERLMEHRDGSGARATAGRSPRLVWFRTFPTRDGATAEESSLKALCRDNPRQVRRMILAFQDVVGELDFG